MQILVTGGTGKVGGHFISGLLDEPRFFRARSRALCHDHMCDDINRVVVVRGSIDDRRAAVAASANVKHVVQIAISSKKPDDVMVKGRDDHVSAVLEAVDNPGAERKLSNICVDRPADYAEVATYPAQTRNTPSAEISSGFHCGSVDNSKAKYLPDWRPNYNLEMLIDSAWQYERPKEEPRIVWYPG